MSFVGCDGNAYFPDMSWMSRVCEGNAYFAEMAEGNEGFAMCPGNEYFAVKRICEGNEYLAEALSEGKEYFSLTCTCKSATSHGWSAL